MDFTSVTFHTRQKHMNISKGRLEITTNIGCKIDCRFCPQSVLIKQYTSKSKENKPILRLTFDNFKKCINTLPKEMIICFAGMSEPWLNPECTDMLVYAYEQGYSVAVYTSLVGMKPEDFERIKDFHYEEFVIHLPDNERNSKIEITEEYINLLENIVEYKQSGISCVTDYSCHGTIHNKIKEILLTDTKSSTEFNDRAGNITNNEIKKEEFCKGQMLCIRCKDNLNNNVLLPDGSVVLCCMDYGMKHVLGNLLYSSYEEILESKEAEYIRQGMKDDLIDILCRSCVNAKDIYNIYDYYCEYQTFAMSLLGENKKLKIREEMFLK